MPEKKHLKLEVLTTKWGKLLRIVEQTHRGDKFGEEGHRRLQAENGFELISDGCPRMYSDALFVRSDDPEQDGYVIWVPDEGCLALCRAAVRDYNQYFSGDDKRQVEPDADVEVIE